jgi:aminoglycoside 2'-N-acetyltransferase I
MSDGARVPPVVALRTDLTSALSRTELATMHRFVVAAFDGSFSVEDWDHALGGVHVTAWGHDVLLGHGSVVPRRLVHGAATLSTGYVEAVAVHPDQRRRGIAGRIMGAIEAIVEREYALGALSATDSGAALYETRGWIRWRGRTGVLTPQGIVATPEDDGSIFVWPVAVTLDWDVEIVCDWRTGDVW